MDLGDLANGMLRRAHKTARWGFVALTLLPTVIGCGGGGGGGGGNPSASVSIQSSAVNPTSLREGEQFIANATLAYSDCDDPSVKFTYGILKDSAAGSTRQASFDAVLGQNSVGIAGYCGDATASTTKNITVTQTPVASVDSRNLLLTPNNPVNGTTYTVTGQGVGINMQADSVEGVAPDGARRMVRGTASTITFNQTYNAVQSGTFRLITYGNGVKPDTATAVLTVRAPSTPVMNPIADATIVEDDSVSSTLSATNCTNPVFSLGMPNNPNYAATITGATLIRKFVPDSSGSGSVTVGATCNEGTAAPVNANLTVSAQPDLTLQLEELAGGALPSTVTVGANGKTYSVKNGDKIQLIAGQNNLQLVHQAGLLSYTGWKLAGLPNGATEVPLNDSLPNYTLTVGSADRAVTIRVLRNDHPEYSGAAKTDADVVYGPIGGDTSSVIHYLYITKPGATLPNGVPLNNQAMTPASLAAWREVYDSANANEAKAAALSGRPRKTYVFETDSTVTPIWVQNPNGTYRPQTGYRFRYDSQNGQGGIAFFNQQGHYLSGVALTPVPNVISRQHESGMSEDGARSDKGQNPVYTRNSLCSGNCSYPADGQASRGTLDWFKVVHLEPIASNAQLLGAPAVLLR